MKKVLLVVCCFLVLVSVASGIWATRATNIQQSSQSVDTGTISLAPGLTMQDMVAQSELIVTGRCLSTRSVWIDRSLVTIATISVGETIKGSEASTVDVVLPGGADSNRRIPVAMTYPGAPTIQPQEDVFLFLTQAGVIANSYAVMGFAQGKFSIVENNQGEKLVSRDLTKVRLQAGAGVVRGNFQTTYLSDFKAKVREYLR